MSETTSFVDPVFLATWGLGRGNVLDYFLSPLNPFKTKATTSNEVLMMQNIGISILIQFGTNNQPMTPVQAEEEYMNMLKSMTGEQYELMPPVIKPEHRVSSNALNQLYLMPAQLYVIRHVLRTSRSTVKVLGIYYVVEGIIYKSPAVRSVCKTNVARTLGGLSAAGQALSVCARYLPATGYTWLFEDAIAAAKSKSKDDKKDEKDDDDDDENDDEDNKHGGMDPVKLYQLCKKRKRRKILDHRRPGERTAAEEEGIRASEAIDQILVRLSKSPLMQMNTTTSTTTAAAATTKKGTPKKTPSTPVSSSSATNTPTKAASATAKAK